MYPANKPFESGFLDVGDGHELYYERHGNPDGIPAVFLHGGPGAGFHEDAHRLFNPEKYNLVLFDQRGATRSRPYACLENNTIPDLVSDIEKIRTHFGIDKWLMVGGSWGSALALFYALKHSETLIGLIMTGICFADRKSTNWLAEEGGASELMPEWFAPYRDLIPPEERKDGLVAAYYKRITEGTKEECLEAVKQFTIWDTSILRHELPLGEIEDIKHNPEEHISLNTHFFHYARNYYTDEHRDLILNGVKTLGHIPCTIIHGRYDLICPVSNAYLLHKAWPNSDLFIQEHTGHSMTEKKTAAKVIEITDSFKVS